MLHTALKISAQRLTVEVGQASLQASLQIGMHRREPPLQQGGTAVTGSSNSSLLQL